MVDPYLRWVASGAMATDTATLKKGTRVVVNTDLPEAEWEDFQANREQAEAAAAAKATATAEAPAEGAGDGAAAPADDRLAALLARSKAARERKAG